MKYICCLVVVNDIKRSRKLYEKILNQKVVNDFGENVSFEGGFAIHQRDHFKRLIGDKEIVHGSNSFELYFEDDNLEEIERLLANERIKFIHNIQEQPWRQFVMRFYDYDNNIIEIGERMEHVAYRLHKEKVGISEIMKISCLSQDTIEKATQEYEK